MGVLNLYTCCGWTMVSCLHGLPKQIKSFSCISQCFKVYFSTKKLISSTVSSSFGEKSTIVEYIFTICKFMYHTKIKYTQKQTICICQCECA